jgi:hypothetical protein
MSLLKRGLLTHERKTNIFLPLESPTRRLSNFLLSNRTRAVRVWGRESLGARRGRAVPTVERRSLPPRQRSSIHVRHWRRPAVFGNNCASMSFKHAGAPSQALRRHGDTAPWLQYQRSSTPSGLDNALLHLCGAAERSHWAGERFTAGSCGSRFLFRVFSLQHVCNVVC